MTFAEHFFGKPLETLDFVADIEPFIRKEAPESQTLEYKSAGSPLSQHGDVISAFLNSGGGLLLIGTPREAEVSLDGGRKGKVCRGGFTPLPFVSKDDARRSLLSKVTPLPSAVLVSPVPCPRGCVIVVEVESSTYPPHQHDGTYWIRLDGETRRAPHALVESLFLQRRGPNLECSLQFLSMRLSADESQSNWRDQWDFAMKLAVVNNSRNIAEYVSVDVKTDQFVATVNNGFQPSDPQPGDDMLTVVTDEERCVLQRYRLRSDVLHANEWKALEGELRYSRSMDWNGPRSFAMTIDLQAKDMLRRRYEFIVPLGMGTRGQIVEPQLVTTIDSPPGVTGE